MDIESQQPPSRNKSIGLRLKRSLLFLTPPGPSVVEKSRFSPDTPTHPSPPSASYSFFTRNRASPTSQAPPTPAPAVVETPPWVNPFHSPPPPQPQMTTEPEQNRVKAAFARLLRQPTSPTLPTISRPLESYSTQPSFHPWGPLNLEKRNQAALERLEREKKAKLKKRRRNIFFGVAGVLIVILVVVIILVLRLKPGRSRGNTTNDSSPGGGQNNGTTTGDIGVRVQLTAEQTKCLTDFKIVAPFQPKNYPTSTCLPILQAIPPAFNTQNPADADVIDAAISFSILRAIYDSSASAAQTALDGQGWFKDAKICTWRNIECGGDGRINSLELISPSVPDVIPLEITGLKGLQTLNISGDNLRPQGKLPALPSSIRSFQALSTALEGPLGEDVFTDKGGLNKLETLRMIGNAKLGTTIPQSLLSVPLQTLTIQSQNLTISISDIFNSPTFATTLKTLNLPFNSLTGQVPSASNLASLTSLDLSDNDFTSISSTTSFPPSLTFVSFSGNDGLLGSLPDSFCSSSVLTSCLFQRTGFSQLRTPTCGICQF